MNSAPEDSELTTSVMKIDRVVDALHLGALRGRMASVSSVVAPTNMKFQPTPSSTSASQKCTTSTPASAIATQTTFSATPVTA